MRETTVENKRALRRHMHTHASLLGAALTALLNAGQEMKEKGTFTFAQGAIPFAKASSFMASRREG